MKTIYNLINRMFNIRYRYVSVYDRRYVLSLIVNHDEREEAREWMGRL